MKALRDQRYLLWLLPPLALYIVPLVLGYAWNSMLGPNVLNPPEGYVGRAPAIPITAESWGTAVVVVPFHARLAEFLRTLTLPLWNPYQGLGQPFAAQGEGSPYFPLAIIRALLPYSWSNWVTVGMFGVAGLFVTSFLRGLGLAARTAVFGGIAFTVSGAVIPHVPRDNIADQLCLAPILFWATAAAVRERTARRFAVLAVVSGLHVLAGFVQIAMLATVLAVVLALVLAAEEAPSRWVGLGRAVAVNGAIGVGTALVAFYLLPMFETMASSHSQNLRLVFMNPPVPIGNLVSFFLPLVFGHPFVPSWIAPGLLDARSMPDDWNDLFAFAGLLPLLLVLGGVTVRRWRSRHERVIFLFCSIAALLLMLRYLSFAPFDLIDTLPPFSLQTRKHANGLTVLLLIVAAALALNNADQWRRRRALVFQLGAIALVYLEVVHRIVSLALSDKVAVLTRLNEVGVHFLTVSALTTVLVALPLVLFAIGRIDSRALQIMAVAVVIAEAVTYVPLGVATTSFLYTRVAVAALVVGTGALAASRQPVLAIAPAVLALAGYAWMIVSPPAGLPRAFDTDRVPRFMAWLRDNAGDEYRTFGIFPDFSSIGQIQDLGVVGPLAPREFQSMVELVGDTATVANYEGSPIFMMAGRLSLPLGQYRTKAPIFDWLGVRYLVLDRSFFQPAARTDDSQLLAEPDRFSVAYEDDRVRIIQSAGVRPKAEFWSSVRTLPNREGVIAALKRNPELILGPPLVEAADQQRIGLSESDSGGPLPVTVVEYRPNRVVLSVEATTPGLVVLKDVYTLGWSATVDGRAAELVRVDGLVRGVPVSTAGRHQIVFTYQPASLTLAVVLAGLAVLLVLALTVLGLARPLAPLPIWAVGCGLAISVLLVGGLGWTFLARPAPESAVAATTLAPEVPAVAFNPEPPATAGGPAIATPVPKTTPPQTRLTEGSVVLVDTTAALAGAGPGRDVVVPPGGLVLGGDGVMRRANQDGTWTIVSGDLGQRVRLANVGPWSIERRAYDGLDAVYDGSRWVMDVSSMHAANLNATFSLASELNPVPDWVIAPSIDDAIVQHQTDAEGPFVRIQARRDLTHLAVQTAFPLNTLDGAPVSVRAQVRLHSAGEVRVSIFDQTGEAAGQNRTLSQSTRRLDEWTTLVLRADRVTFPSNADTLFLASYDLHEGDWFDVRELSLYVGTLPPGLYPTILPAPCDPCATTKASARPAVVPVARVDLAIGHPARQSSTEPGGEAFVAVDGSESTPSLAVGRNGQPPWWEVDLGAVSPLEGIEIGFHTGCCADGGRSAYVFLADRPFETDDPILAAATPGVVAFAIDTPTAVQTLHLSGRTARYIRIQSTRPGWLRLGSVHVWQAPPETITPETGQSPSTAPPDRPKPPDRTNLALGRRTRQSSTVAPNTANYAVDGRTDGDITQGSLALTQPEPQAWWEVDLADTYEIGDILIWNRTDCCQNWLQGYYVLVSDEPIVSPRLAQAAGQPGVISYYVPGGGVSPTTIAIRRPGRYVRIQLSRADPLALAEVQVLAP